MTTWLSVHGFTFSQHWFPPLIWNRDVFHHHPVTNFLPIEPAVCRASAHDVQAAKEIFADLVAPAVRAPPLRSDGSLATVHRR
jgi:hypothetical protein